MNIAEQVQELKTVIGQLPRGKQDFASSLVQQFERRHSLSPKQEPYVAALLAQATQEKQTAEVGDFGGVITLFRNAKEKLKFPKITLQVDHEAVILKLAGERSRTPGAVYVMSEGGYGNSTFYGSISKDGIFEQSPRALDKMISAFGAELIELLRTLASDPIKVVQAQAKLTGHCIFCNKHLTDDRSKAAGFGPVCAQKWDLHDAWKQAAKVAPQMLAVAKKDSGIDDLLAMADAELEQQKAWKYDGVTHPANEYEAQLEEEEVNHNSNEDHRGIYRRTA